MLRALIVVVGVVAIVAIAVNGMKPLMGAVRRVTDADDTVLGDYVGLTDMALRTRREPAEGLFIAEGDKVIRRALDAGYVMRSMLLEEKWLASMTDVVEQTDAPVYLADLAVLERVTGYSVHRGALAADGPPAAARRPRAGCGRTAAGHPRRGQQPHQHRCRAAVRRGSRRRRGAARPALRGPALPPVGEGVDGRRFRGAVGPADPVAVGAGRRTSPRFHRARPDPGTRGDLAGRPHARGAPSAPRCCSAPRARASRPRPSPRPTCGSASRWRQGSTR